MWLKRLVNQTIRGSFEYFINMNKEIQRMEHVIEVTDDITNLESSINMNL